MLYNLSRLDVQIVIYGGSFPSGGSGVSVTLNSQDRRYVPMYPALVKPLDLSD